MQIPKVDWDPKETVIFSTPEHGPTVEGVRKMMEMTGQLKKNHSPNSESQNQEPKPEPVTAQT